MDIPSDPQAEEGALSCLLSLEAGCYHDAIEAGINRSWFYEIRNEAVFDAIVLLETSGTPASVQSVRHQLGGQIEAIGGLARLLELADASPSALMPRWLELLRDANLRRTCRVLGEKLVSQSDVVEAGEQTLSDSINECSGALDGAMVRSSMSGSALSGAYVNELERRKTLADLGKRSGIATGLHRLDKMTDGLQFGEQFIVGARPSQGKTALGLTIAAHVAITQQIPTLIISCEMSTASLMMRLASIVTEVPLSFLRSGQYTEAEATKMLTFSKKVSKTPLYIYDAISGSTSDQVAAVIRQHARRYGVKFVVVDYLQKIRASRKNEKRTYEVAEVSGTLKSAAVASNVALMTLAQVNRESEKGDKSRGPRMSDLADSGQIERDADVVALLHRDEEKGHGASLLNLAKQRDGETGVMSLLFNAPITRFENAPL